MKKTGTGTTVTEGSSALALQHEDVHIPKGRLRISRTEITIRNILKMIDSSKIRFDLAIQRNTVWKKEQRSLLIHSVLDNYPIPAVFIQASDDDVFWMLDGKQRNTTFHAYATNQFPLLKGTPAVMTEKDGAVEYEEVEGKFFKDLSPELQGMYLDYSLYVMEVRNATPAQVEEIFQRLNNGSPLTKIELTRARSGHEVMNYVNSLSDMAFFKQYSNLSDTARNRFVDSEVILQTMMLVMGREAGISSKEVADFVEALKKQPIDEEVKKVMKGTAMYLEDAFKQFVTIVNGENGEPDKVEMKVLDKILKKIHLPMLFLTAIDSINREVYPEAFGLWAKDFLLDTYKPGVGTYGSRCVAGSAKKENVQGRIKAMKANFNTNIDKFNADVEEALKIKALAGAAGDKPKADGEDKGEENPDGVKQDQEPPADPNLIEGDEVKNPADEEAAAGLDGNKDANPEAGKTEGDSDEKTE